MKHLVSDEERWKARPCASQVVSALVLMGPIGISLGVTVILAGTLPVPIGVLPHLIWWGTVLAGATVSVFGSERLFRRLLPLGALLKLTMLFPDAAPSRMRVAIKAGSTRDLERRFRDASEGKLCKPAQSAANILSLAAAINNHDRATRGHSERVRVLTEMIAEELGLSQADRDRLRWASLLHDVGKLSIHPDILNSTKKLTEAEWDIIRQHPIEGLRLTAPLQGWFGEWGLAIAQHHERYDGMGYPFGISGTSISLGARIVAVADSFEVMTASRTYKQAITLQQARIELIHCAETQFDPDIVRAFLNISIGRLRWIIGPASWLAEAPLAQWVANATKTLGTGAHLSLAAMALVSSAIVASPLLKRSAPLTAINTSSLTGQLTSSSGFANGSGPEHAVASERSKLAREIASVSDVPAVGKSNPAPQIATGHSPIAPVQPQGVLGGRDGVGATQPSPANQNHGQPPTGTGTVGQLTSSPAKAGGQPLPSSVGGQGAILFPTAPSGSTSSGNSTGIGHLTTAEVTPVPISPSSFVAPNTESASAQSSPTDPSGPAPGAG